MGTLKQTHTYAELELSKAAYDETATKLRTAGYDHVFMEDGTIDMHGIGVTCEAEPVLIDMALGPDHTCECSACVERSGILRALVFQLCPGVVLTCGGKPIDHNEINALKERAFRTLGPCLAKN